MSTSAVCESRDCSESFCGIPFLNTTDNYNNQSINNVVGREYRENFILENMASTLTAGPGLLTSSGGKRRGRKPGLNSTVAQRSAANARERSRMRVLSGAFVELKGALPWVPKDTKLSKLDTLKLAAGYIAYLRRILDTGSSFATALSTSVSDSDDVMTESDSLVGDVNPDHPIHLLRLAAQTDQPTTVRWVDSKQTDERQICSTDSSVYSELHSLEQFSVNNRLIDSIYHTVPAVRSEIPFPSMMKMSHPGLKEVLVSSIHLNFFTIFHHPFLSILQMTKSLLLRHSVHASQSLSVLITSNEMYSQKPANGRGQTIQIQSMTGLCNIYLSRKSQRILDFGSSWNSVSADCRPFPDMKLATRRKVLDLGEILTRARKQPTHLYACSLPPEAQIHAEWCSRILIMDGWLPAQTVLVDGDHIGVHCSGFNWFPSFG